jgi:hypothetical protein
LSQTVEFLLLKKVKPKIYFSKKYSKTNVKGFGSTFSKGGKGGKGGF